MNFFKSYIFRIYPNKKDLKFLNQCLAANRFVYNSILNLMISNSKNGEKHDLKYYLHYLDFIVYENSWLKICPKEILKINIFELFTLFDKNILIKNNIVVKQIKYPNFKGCYDHTNIFRINSSNNNIHLELASKKIIIDNFLSLRIKGYKNIDFSSMQIVSVTFLCRFGKKYYAIVSTKCVKKMDYKNIDFSKMVGVDIGIKHLIVTSDRTFYENMHFGPKSEKRLNLLKKIILTKQSGSKNYIKAKMKLDREYFILKQRRKHYIYKIVNEITDKYDVIFIENLDVGSMLENSKFSYMLRDASFYKIMQIFERKCLEKNKKLVKINRFFPSSQLCSCCGKINKKYRDLSERVFKCESCGFIED